MTKTTFLLLLATLVLIGCGKAPSNTPPQQEAASVPSPTQPAPSAPADEKLKLLEAAYEEILNEPGTVEARDWVQRHPDATIGSAEKKPLESFVTRFYGAGVQRIGIETLGERAASMIVVMPTEAEARKKAITIANELAPLFEDEPYKDIGFRFLYYELR